MVTRVRPSIRRTVRVLLPILILVGAWQILDNIETRRLETAFDAIRPFLPAGQNASRQKSDQESAGRFYAAAAAVAVQEDGATVPQDSLPSLLLRLRGALQGSTDASPSDVSRSDAVLARNDLTLQLLNRGAGLPFDEFAPGTEFNYRWSGTWTAERVGALATLDALRRRDAGAAAHSLASRLRLLRVADDKSMGPLWAADLVVTQAIDLSLLLPLPGLTEADLQLLQDAFANVIDDEALRREIAGYARSRYDFVAAVSGARSWQYGHLGVPLRPLLSHRVVTTLETSADALEIAKRPWPERLTGMKGLKDRPSIVRNVFLPYPWWQVAEQMQLVTTAMGRGVAASHAARVALAADVYRRRVGRLPGALAELGLDRDVVLDPFSGQPLIYRADGRGFTVYSVGVNGRDDSAAIDVQPTKGTAPGRGERPDIGVKVTYATPPR